MSNPLHPLIHFLHAHPYTTTTLALTLTIATLAYRDYVHYISFGPHGLPNTLRGYTKQLKMTLKARKDITVPAPYNIDLIAGPHDKDSYLPQNAKDALKWRPGNKPPTVPNFVAPQRQVTEKASEEMKRTMFDHLDKVVSEHPHLLQTQTSVLEGPIPAMGIKDFAALPDSAKPKVLRPTRGEMSHIHPQDGSTHLILSLADQKRVIELGWGMRHRLSGGLLPWNYTLVYAPRDEGEFEVWKSVVAAAVGFCGAVLKEE